MPTTSYWHRFQENGASVRAGRLPFHDAASWWGGQQQHARCLLADVKGICGCPPSRIEHAFARRIHGSPSECSLGVVLAIVIAGSVAPAAATSPLRPPRLTHAGRFFTDAQGRVVILNSRPQQRTGNVRV